MTTKQISKPRQAKAKPKTGKAEAADTLKISVPGPNFLPPEGGGKAPPKKQPPKPNQRSLFIWAEGQQESGNNYSARNPESGALGRWQVMPANLPDWLPESGFPVLSPSAFLASHAAQDAVANHILGGYFDRFGAAGAAAMWYSGQSNPNATFGDPPVFQYVKDVLAIMASSGSPGDIEMGETGGGAIEGTPVAGSDDWSAHIRNAQVEMVRAGQNGSNWATHIRNLVQ